HQVGLEAVEALGHGVAVALDEHLVVLALEVVADGGGQAGAVLDQQDATALGGAGGGVPGKGGFGKHGEKGYYGAISGPVVTFPSEPCSGVTARGFTPASP